MKILTRSSRVRRVLRAVEARVPSGDWQKISSFLTSIETDREWAPLGMSEELDPQAAMLRPFYSFEDGKPTVTGSHILFRLPICRLYSDEAMVGLASHELAHALRAQKIGENWLRKMGGIWSAGADSKYQSEERHADRIASKWGFGKEIRAMREERQKVLNPFIASNEQRIMSRLMKRMERQNAPWNDRAQ